MLKTIVSVLLGLSVLFIGPSAFALDIQFFESVPWINKSVTVMGSDTLPVHSFETGAYIHWAYQPIEIGLRRSNQRLDSLVDHHVAIEPQLAYGLTRRSMLFATLPLYTLYDLESLDTATGSSGSAIGDLRLNGIYRLHEKGAANLGGWGLALGLSLTLPTGDESNFVGNQNVTGGVRLIADRALSQRDRVKVNLATRFRERERVANLSVGHEFIISLGYTRTLLEKHLLEGFVELKGSTTYDQFLSEEISSPSELLIGLRKAWIKQHLQTVLGAGRGLSVGYGAPEMRLFAGATLAIGRLSQPKPVGPSHLQIDVFTQEGLPLDASITVVSLQDKASVGDGFGKQWLRELPPRAYEFLVRADGYDSAQGRLSVQPEKHARAKVYLRKKLGKRLETLRPVLFDTNKATIKRESEEVLRAMVQTIQRYPEIRRLQVEAHTDDQASASYNLELSQRRAKSVMNFLIQNGVASEMLFYKGFGKFAPIDTNSTKEGRARNRRVEFFILEAIPATVVVKEYSDDELYNLGP